MGRISFDRAWCATRANASVRGLLGIEEIVGRQASQIVRQARVLAQNAAPPLRLPASRYRVLRTRDGAMRGFLLHYTAHGDGCRLALEPAEWSLGFLDRLHTGVAATDERGIIVYVNGALTEMLGFAPPEVLGRYLVDIASAIAVRPSDAKLVGAAAANRQTLTDTFAIRLPGRPAVRLHIQTTEWRYRGLPCGLIWSARGETDTQEAKHQDAVVFAYRLAALLQHELRNPLQTIQAAVEVLRPMQPATATRTLDLLEQQVRVISEYLAEQLQPPVPGSMTHHLLSDVVADEIERAQVRLTTRRLRFRHHRPANEPSLRLHAGAMGRAFANLFRNTAQARPDARVDIRYARRNDQMACIMTDDGPGFPPGILSGRWLTPVGGGPEHFGLVVVTSTVQAHGGSVLMENTRAGGARVTVALPLHRGRVATAPATGTALQVGSP